MDVNRLDLGKVIAWLQAAPIQRTRERTGGRLSGDTERLTIAGWRPHLRTETDYDLPPDLLYMVSYLPWEKTRHLSGGWWQRQWPELVAAAS